MVATNRGRLDWTLDQDDEGGRTYGLETLVETDDVEDGPATVLAASGNPAIGSTWSYGNDDDPWAYCYPTATVKRHPGYRPGEIARFWILKQKFSTVPFKRCQDTSIENPLSEPPKISGSFARFTRPTEKDRNGDYIKSSSHEIIQGLERSDSRPTVVIAMNIPYLPLGSFAAMVNTVNDSAMWGVAERSVMLTNVQWSRNVYGTCGYYFTVTYEFEINWDTYDLLDIADTGYKVLAGRWSSADPPVWIPNGASADDPTHFDVFTDPKGNPYPRATLLDGSGNPLTSTSSPVFLDPVELYAGSNFFALGVPSFLG